MKNLMKILFAYWYILGYAFVTMDIASYSMVFGVDACPITNREFNVPIIFAIVHVPYMIAGILMYLSLDQPFGIKRTKQ